MVGGARARLGVDQAFQRHHSLVAHPIHAQSPPVVVFGRDTEHLTRRNGELIRKGRNERVLHGCEFGSRTPRGRRHGGQRTGGVVVVVRHGRGRERGWERGRALDGRTRGAGSGDKLAGGVGRNGDSPGLFDVRGRANVAGRIAGRVVVAADGLAHASGPGHSLAHSVADEAFADDEYGETDEDESANDGYDGSYGPPRRPPAGSLGGGRTRSLSVGSARDSGCRACHG